MAAFLFVCFFWIIPIVVARDIGDRRNRAGWVYGLLLGWIGVLIVSLTSYLPSDAEIQMRELEAQHRLNEIGVSPAPKPIGIIDVVKFGAQSASNTLKRS